MIRLVPVASFITHTKILTRWNISRAHLPGPSQESGQKEEIFFFWKWAGLEQLKSAESILSSLWVYSWATWFIPRLQAVHLQAHQSRPANLLLLNLYAVSRFWLQLTIKTKLPTSERATQNKVRISGIPLADEIEADYTASLSPVSSKWIAEVAWSPAWANGGPHRARLISRSGVLVLTDSYEWSDWTQKIWFPEKPHNKDTQCELQIQCFNTLMICDFYLTEQFHKTLLKMLSSEDP